MSVLLVCFGLCESVILEQQQLPLVVIPYGYHHLACPRDEELVSARCGIKDTVTNILEDYYDNIPSCGPGLWKRIAYVNMSDPSQDCPSRWREYVTDPNVRSCIRPQSSISGCVSETFSSGESEYNRVCGRAIAYQNGSTDAFGRFVNGFIPTLNNAYVDGLSITYGANRTHIWTFAAGNSEVRPASSNRVQFACYCGDNSNGTRPPSFVGNNFFCESAVNSDIDIEAVFYSSDPLWDGMNCPNSNCCDFNSPPWFVVDLPTSTTDDIEARICCDEGTMNENIAIQLLEIFIQ